MTLNDLEPRKIGVLMNFSRFQAVIHILSVNCVETIRDRPGQRAYEMFGIKRRLQRCKGRPPRFKESIRVHQFRVPPSKCAVSATVDQSSKITVADRHRLAAYRNKHCRRAFQGCQHRWPWTPKIGVFSEFFAILGCDAHLEWIFAEITGDRPRQPVYEIKLMLSRVSWALAQISCLNLSTTTFEHAKIVSYRQQ